MLLVEHQVRVREVVNDHHVARLGEVDQLLEEAEVDDRRRGVVREGAEDDARLRLGALVRLDEVGEEVRFDA